VYFSQAVPFVKNVWFTTGVEGLVYLKASPATNAGIDKHALVKIKGGIFKKHLVFS
jgi:hypothetical protein